MDLDMRITKPRWEETVIEGEILGNWYRIPVLRLHSPFRKQDVEAVHTLTPGFGIRKEDPYPYLYKLNHKLAVEKDPVHVISVDMPAAEGFQSNRPKREWDHTDYLNVMGMVSRKIRSLYDTHTKKINFGYSLTGTISLLSNVFDEQVTYGAALNTPNRQRMKTIIDVAGRVMSNLPADMLVLTSGMEWPTLAYYMNETRKDDNLEGVPKMRPYPIGLLKDILYVYDTMEERIEGTASPVTWVYGDKDNIIKDSVNVATDLEVRRMDQDHLFKTYELKGGTHGVPIINPSLSPRYEYNRGPLNELVELVYEKGRNHY